MVINERFWKRATSRLSEPLYLHPAWGEVLLNAWEEFTRSPQNGVFTDPKRMLPEVSFYPSRDGRGDGKKRAVVNVEGIIYPKASYLPVYTGTGYTFLDGLIKQLRTLVDDPEVEEIILRVDSPGGLAFGVAEAAREIRAMSQQKPITAFADGLMASAAYYLSSAANKIVATRSAEVGSVGVIMLKMDVTKMLNDMGVNVAIIASGEAKADYSVFRENSEDVLQRLQEIVDQTANVFVSDVLQYRSDVDANEIRKAKVYTAEQAREVMMVDEVTEKGFDGYMAGAAAPEASPSPPPSTASATVSTTTTTATEEYTTTTTTTPEMNITPPQQANDDTPQDVSPQLFADIERHYEALVQSLQSEIMRLETELMLARHAEKLSGCDERFVSAVRLVAQWDARVAETLLTYLPVVRGGAAMSKLHIGEEPAESAEGGGLRITPPLQPSGRLNVIALEGREVAND